MRSWVRQISGVRCTVSDKRTGVRRRDRVHFTGRNCEADHADGVRWWYNRVLISPILRLYRVFEVQICGCSGLCGKRCTGYLDVNDEVFG